jgi:hypothetical protein
MQDNTASGRILERGKHPHRCKPKSDPLVYHGATYEDYITPPIGTVWRCDCGRLWEVRKYHENNVPGVRRWHAARLITQWRYRNER